MNREEKKEEMRGFYSSLFVSMATAAIILYAAVLKFSSPLEPMRPHLIENKEVIEDSASQNIATMKEQELDTDPKSREETPTDPMIPSPLRKGTDLYASGNMNSAASAWERMIKAPEQQASFTIQLLLACKRETISNAFKNCDRRDDLFFVRSQYKEMTCYKLCMGLYANSNEAEHARRTIPDYFTRTGNRPVIIPISKLIESTH